MGERRARGTDFIIRDLGARIEDLGLPRLIIDVVVVVEEGEGEDTALRVVSMRAVEVTAGEKVVPRSTLDEEGTAAERDEEDMAVIHEGGMVVEGEEEVGTSSSRAVRTRAMGVEGTGVLPHKADTAGTALPSSSSNEVVRPPLPLLNPTHLRSQTHPHPKAVAATEGTAPPLLRPVHLAVGVPLRCTGWPIWARRKVSTGTRMDNRPRRIMVGMVVVGEPSRDRGSRGGIEELIEMSNLLVFFCI